MHRYVLLLALIPTIAFAQTAPPAGAPPADPAGPPAPGATPAAAATPAATVTAQPTGELAGVNEDPNADHAFFTSNALTQPKGSIEINDWELLLLGATYAFTDNIQASLTTMIPLTKDFPLFLIGSAKFRIPLASDRLHLAAMGSLLYTHESASAGTSSATFNWLGGFAQGLVTYCLDANCGSTLNGEIGFGFSISDSNPAVPLLYGGSIVGRISSHFKLLAELDSGGYASLNSNLSSYFIHGVEFTYGVRFNAHAVAVDLGFTRPIAANVDSPLIVGIPIVAVSGRFGI